MAQPNPIDVHPLLPVIEQFLRRTGIAATTFGDRAARNSELVKRLRVGGDMHRNTERRVIAWMQSDAPRHIKPRPRSAA